MNLDLSSTRKQKQFAEGVENEEKLRSKWFAKNEEKLVAQVERGCPKRVTDSDKEQVKSDRQKRYQNIKRMVKKVPEEEPPLVDPKALYNVMKPVDPNVKKLLYTGTQKDGRSNYLKKRVKLLPEEKFYFTECVNWTYGWGIWNHERQTTPFGRKRIIQNSFYRKNNVGRDPDWYQEPARLSPMVCGIL